ncbi:NAD-dependent epimerase/dehydratase family protein [Candidatus Amarolinea dominans]|uniref:NAD-dependent epimerase/dehydratase family protein n=1 Tax=Candidatus Amarolinea dominans TaxID=3140696 RepID=UPI003136A09D|nr:NAD-dependent epimerase/dehydratase family protein [Anaerolineae bacterium]
MTTQPKQPSWPDSNLFWRNQRVTVTGGAGFLGSFVVDKLRERGATEICVSRKQDYDLVHREAVLELLVIRGKNPIFATNDTNYHESEHFVKTRGRERNL